MADKTYRIDFWTVSLVPSATYADLRSVFRALIDRGASYSTVLNGYVREVRELGANVSRSSFWGSVAKFRVHDLPHRGMPGGGERQLVLAENEGLIEKNYFHFNSRRNLLMWQSNRNANGSEHLCKLLADFSQCRIRKGVVATRTATERLLNGENELKSYEFSLAKPTAVDVFPRGARITNQIAEIFAAGGGDSISVKSSVDSRLKTGSSGFTEPMREALAAISRYPKARRVVATIVNDDGEQEALDLLADRIKSLQTIELVGRYPNANSVFAAFQRAYREQRQAIDEVLAPDADGLA